MDAAIDHEDLERRDSLQTLRVLASVVLLVCACVAVAWLLIAGASG